MRIDAELAELSKCRADLAEFQELTKQVRAAQKHVDELRAEAYGLCEIIRAAHADKERRLRRLDELNELLTSHDLLVPVDTANTIEAKIAELLRERSMVSLPCQRHRPQATHQSEAGDALHVREDGLSLSSSSSPMYPPSMDSSGQVTPEICLPKVKRVSFASGDAHQGGIMVCDV